MSETRPGPAESAAGKGAQTRHAVLQAAIARFGREGYRATSVADVARDAGVGGTVPYAYFPNKEALFLAAVDEDAAALISEITPTALSDPTPEWPGRLIGVVLEAMVDRPLASRLLAGKEPEVTGRILEIPALIELRKSAAEFLRSGQANGSIRVDIDPVAAAGGIVTIMLSLIMSVTQIGPEAVARYGAEVAEVLRASLSPAEAGSFPT